MTIHLMWLSDLWHLMEAERRTLGQRVWSLHSPGSRPAQQHSGHNINSTNSSAPTTIEQRQSRPGARLVQGARCWWHIGRIQHISLDTKYEKMIKFQPMLLMLKGFISWVTESSAEKSEIIITLLNALVTHNLDLTCGTWKSSWHTSSTKKEPTLCTSCLQHIFIIRMFLYYVWGISSEFDILTSQIKQLWE